MKNIVSLNNIKCPYIIDIDETLRGKISLEEVHLIISKSVLEMEQSTLYEQFKKVTNGSVGALYIKTTEGHYVAKINVSISGDVATYTVIQVFSDIDCTIVEESNKVQLGFISPVMFDISMVGAMHITVGVLMTTDVIDSYFAENLISHLTPPEGEGTINVNPFIKNAVSCELYVNDVLVDTFLPFESNFYWFGTGLNYIEPFYWGVEGPRFGVFYNGSRYYTDKLTSDTAVLNSILRLSTYTDYIIFR